jgi:hypothetical protein
VRSSRIAPCGGRFAAGFNECVTFSFIADKAAREFADEADLVPIANPSRRRSRCCGRRCCRGSSTR